jgi:2-polyprenyl-3-methyl-5-hydroxy-6-metoxy-1,4-benzoquinol methylase
VRKRGNLEERTEHAAGQPKDETRRVRDIWKEREERSALESAERFNYYGHYAVYERNELILDIFRNCGLLTLAGMEILDVGCSGGALLRHLYDFGAKPENCPGVDLRENALRIAKHLSPNAGYALASGARLPFADGMFDLVFQTTVFTSILDRQLRKTIAHEILRTLRGGTICMVRLHLQQPEEPERPRNWAAGDW